MIITRKGSLIPRVFFGFAGHITYVVLRGGGGKRSDVLAGSGVWQEREDQIQWVRWNSCLW